jgi:hypothetical protein
MNISNFISNPITWIINLILYLIILIIYLIKLILYIIPSLIIKQFSDVDLKERGLYFLIFITFITILFLPFMIYNPIYQSLIKTINTINIGMVGNTLIKKYNNYSILSIVFILFTSVYISYKIKAFIDVITKDTDESNKLKYIHVFPIISLGFIMYILLTSYHRIFDHKLFSICDNNNILTILDKYKSIQFNIYYTIITYIFTNYLLYYIIDKYDTENGKSFIKIYIKKIIDIIKKNKEYILPLPPIIFSVISYYISQKAYNTMKQVKEKMDICQDEFEPKQLNFTMDNKKSMYTKDKCTDCLCYDTSNNKCLTDITNAEDCSYNTYVWCPNDKLTHNHTSRNTLYVLYVTILLKILIVFYEVLHNNNTNKGLSLEIIDNILSTIFEKIPIYKYIDFILAIIVAILIFQQFNTLEYNFKSEDIIIPVMVIIFIICIILKLK